MQRAYTTLEIKETLFPIFSANPIDKAILFGSYAKGSARPTSDIDILIDSGGKIRGIEFYGILEDVSTAFDVPVDLIEVSDLVDGGKIQQEIAKTGVVIYEKA